MNINDMINPASLSHDIDEGFIRFQRHPSLPLTIYNYTEKAQFARHWNKATLACRGLIVRDDGEVIARPFPKFFNWNEPKPKGLHFQMSLDELVTVTDKLDGSLGILYPDGWGNFAIATRGSFSSDQALHGTQVWRDKYMHDFAWRTDPRLTYLFEIIYPGNRIVVDYKGLDDLVLIGAVDKRTGTVYGPEVAPGWPGPKARIFPYRTLAEAVQAKPRPGQEGFVVRSLSDGLMVKIKQDDYVALHRIVTALNEKEIWRRAMKADLENDPEIDKMPLVLRDIPDEMHEWVTEIVQRLTTELRLREQRVQGVYMQALPSQVTGLDDRDARKRFAQRIQTREPWLRSASWLLYDGKNPREFLWKLIEPKGDTKK